MKIIVLMQTKNYVTSFLNTLRLVCSAVFIICTFLICIMMKLQGTLGHLPNSLKVTLMGFFCGSIAYLIVEIYIILSESDFVTIQFGNYPLEFEISEVIGNCMVIVTHWLFTSHYLKTACFLQ